MITEGFPTKIAFVQNTENELTQEYDIKRRVFFNQKKKKKKKEMRNEKCVCQCASNDVILAHCSFITF